jgi:L-arabinokinase
VLLALTSHGLGHLTRSLAVACEMRDLEPSLELVVATTIDEARVALELPGPFEYHSRGYEPGTLHQTCFELDVAGTREAYVRYLDQRPQRLESERRFLANTGCAALVADIPALPLRVAADLGLPAVGLSNFSWDWLLQPLLEGSAASGALSLLASDYACGTCHLQLPFGPESSPFPLSEPVPLVCRRARLDRSDVRRRLGLPLREGRPLVMVCPGGWAADGWPPIEVRDGQAMRLLTIGDLPVSSAGPILALPHELPSGLGFPDLVNAADLLLAKPGYGVASECVLHRTPFVGIERPGFRETPVLMGQLSAFGPCAELSLGDFFDGRWTGAIREALDSTAAWVDVAEDGARVVAERILALIGKAA